MTSISGTKYPIAAASGIAALSLLVSGILFMSAPALVGPAGKASEKSQASVQRALKAAVGQLPLAFEPNQGQTDARVDFLARGPGYVTFLSPTEAVMKATGSQGREPVLRLELLGSNPSAKAAAGGQLKGKVNYLRGAPSDWIKGLSTFSKVRYSNVYPGIDLVYYGNQRNLEYDFMVRPGADPSLARMRFEGAEKVILRPNGDLGITVDDETFVQRRPYVYQNIGGRQREVPSSFKLEGETVAFEIGDYDKTKTLVIDPVITYSAFLGGGGADVGFGVAADSSGNAYLTGSTASTNFPVKGSVTCGTATSSLFCRGGDPTGFLDAYVTKINTNAAGADSLLWSTYLGGDNDDVGFDVAVDGDGNVYVAGSTQSADDPGTAKIEASFPTTSNAYDETCGTDGNCNAALPENLPVNLADPTQPPASICRPHPGGNTDCPTSPVPDAFLTKLNPGGSALVYSTFLGGSGFEQENNPAAGALGHMDIALSGAKAFLASTTASSDFPTTADGDRVCGTTGATPQGCNGQTDGFLSVIDTAASGADSLAFSTYVGGDGADSVKGVALDGEGNAYIAGTTVGTNPTPDVPGSPYVNNFPNTNLDQPYNGGSSDGFVAKVGTAGLLEAKVKVDPKANNMNQLTQRDSVKASATSQPLIGPFIYSRYLGGGGIDEIWDVAVHDGSAYVTGFTDSGDDPETPAQDGPQPYFPTTDNAYDTSFNGEGTQTFCVPGDPVCTNSFLNGDAFVTKIDPKGEKVLYSTFLGGIHGDVAHGIVVNSAGAAYVTGYTMCKNQTPGSSVCDAPVPNGSFPTTADAPQPNMGGNFLGPELHNSPTDGFVSKINPAGQGAADLAWSTYLGGNNFDRAYAIAIRGTDTGNEVFVTGRTGSNNFPNVNGFTAAKPSGLGNRDSYVTKISD